MQWDIHETKTLLQTPAFAVEEVSLLDRTSQHVLNHKYYRLDAPSWVNIFAITSDHQVILVRQPRVGLMSMTLEVPGGGIDAGEQPLFAAERELEEETGYRAGTMSEIGNISPNPAIMKNRLYMFLAQNCEIPKVRKHFPDSMERIEVVTTPLSELDSILRSGQFQNALGTLTVLMVLRYNNLLT